MNFQPLRLQLSIQITVIIIFTHMPQMPQGVKRLADGAEVEIRAVTIKKPARPLLPFPDFNSIRLSEDVLLDRLSWQLHTHHMCGCWALPLAPSQMPKKVKIIICGFCPLLYYHPHKFGIFGSQQAATTMLTRLISWPHSWHLLTSCCQCITIRPKTKGIFNGFFGTLAYQRRISLRVCLPQNK